MRRRVRERMELLSLTAAAGRADKKELEKQLKKMEEDSR